MRYIFTLLLCLCMMSCFKYTKVDNSLKYNINGVQDVTIDQNDSATVPLYVELLSGDPTNEYITVRVEGIPANVSSNYDSITFRPNYSFPLTFYGNYPKPGIYPITIKVASPTIGTKSYVVHLTVTAQVDCTAQISQPQYLTNHGARYTQMDGSPTVFTYTRRTGCDTIEFKIMADSMESGASYPTSYFVQHFNAVMNCLDSTLDIYPQPATWLSSNNDVYIKGSGKFVPLTPTSATMYITDTVYSASQIVSIRKLIIY